MFVNKEYKLLNVDEDENLINVKLKFYNLVAIVYGVNNLNGTK